MRWKKANRKRRSYYWKRFAFRNSMRRLVEALADNFMEDTPMMKYLRNHE